MGKDLKGKELGTGLSQRKDKRYSARYEDTHGTTGVTSSVSVNAWFQYWYDNLIVDLSPNTRRNYKERYEKNIKPYIGSMSMCDVKPMNCKLVLNRMLDDYAGSTIKQAYITMGTMFRSAVMNDVISKHPMDGVRYTKPVKPASEHRSCNRC